MERARPDPESDFLIIFSTLTVVAWLTTLVWMERVEVDHERGCWPIVLLWLSVAVSWVQFRVGAEWWRGVAAGFSLSAMLLFTCVG